MVCLRQFENHSHNFFYKTNFRKFEFLGSRTNILDYTSLHIEGNGSEIKSGAYMTIRKFTAKIYTYFRNCPSG